jgi:DNA-binding CsgD family transcriptional regulator
MAEVQALLAQGMSYRNTAVELGTSYNTVLRLWATVNHWGRKSPFF